jgi:hypothetical protein
MAKPKRTPLAFNTNQLTDGLKESAGQGVNAFFSSPVVELPQSQPELPPLSEPEPLKSDISAPRILVEQDQITPLKKVSSTKEQKAVPQKSITRHITILHLDETDITRLREATDRVQTYRLTKHEIEWMKDTAYRLSKELKRGKVAQADILRIAILLFEQYLGVHKDELLEILEKMK